MSSYEIAIVGGGVTGLAAARVLTAHGAEVALYEATDRLGGRIRTAHDGVELGPEFVHGLPHATVDLLHAANLALEPIGDIHRLSHGRHLDTAGDVWSRLAELLDGTPVHDESARTYMAHTPMSPDDVRLFATLVEGFYAAPLTEISMTSLHDDASGAGTTDPSQFRVAGGYGRLVDWLVADLVRANAPVHLDCPVHAIAWRADSVELAYSHAGGEHTAHATRAMVTVPISVLQSRQLAIHPELGDHAGALDGLAMGPVVKIVLCLDEPIWREYAPSDLEFIHARGRFPAFWVHSTAGGVHVATAWAGGPHAAALADLAADELIRIAIAELADALVMPADRLGSAIVHAHYHDYVHDPYTRGAYSFTRVGGSGAADVLARPLGALWFAGEALDPHYEGTVAGAIASGQRAAHEILATV